MDEFSEKDEETRSLSGSSTPNSTDNQSSRDIVSFKTDQDDSSTESDESFAVHAKKKGRLLETEDAEYTSDINYGDIRKDYFESDSISLVETPEDKALCEQVLSQVYSKPGLSKPKHIYELNMFQRSSLISIIKRNRDFGILAPFDCYANLRFVLNYIPSKTCSSSEQQLARQRLATEISLKTEDSVVLNQFVYKPITKELQTALLSNSIAPYLIAKSFFEIFSPSELSQLANKLEPLLELKQSCSSLSPRVSNETLSSHLAISIFCNCFAILTWRFDIDQHQFGFFNYFLSLVSLYDYLDEIGILSIPEANSLEAIQKLGPYYIEAMVLNGFITNSFVRNFKSFAKNTESIKIDSPLIKLIDSCVISPLKLKELSRIAVKRSMIDFSPSNIAALDSSPALKQYLTFDTLFEEFLNGYRKLVDVKC